METTTHTYQAGDYSPRAGRRVCAICGETQGSRFHSVTAPTALQSAMTYGNPDGTFPCSFLCSAGCTTVHTA